VTSDFWSTRGARRLGRVEALGRQPAQQRALAPKRRADRLRPAGDPPPQVRLAAGAQQGVQLRQRGDLGLRDEVVAPEAPDLALDAALLVRSRAAAQGELRLEQVVRAQGDEAAGLDAATTAQHPLDRRAEVVVAHQLEDAAEPLERRGVCLQERLLGLDRRGHAERRTGVAGAHEEQVHLDLGAGEHDPRLAPVDLGLDAGGVNPRHEHLPGRPAELAPTAAHVVAHGRLRDLGTPLVDQPPPDPLRRVALLARRLPVGLDPGVDQRPVRPQLRRRPARRWSLRRRQRRRERLPHRPPVHAIAARQLTDRSALPVAVAPDLLEQLHPRTHLSATSSPSSKRTRTVRSPSDGGGAS
jgi:hypothetical protein